MPLGFFRRNLSSRSFAYCWSSKSVLTKSSTTTTRGWSGRGVTLLLNTFGGTSVLLVGGMAVAASTEPANSWKYLIFWGLRSSSIGKSSGDKPLTGCPRVSVTTTSTTTSFTAALKVLTGACPRSGVVAADAEFGDVDGFIAAHAAGMSTGAPAVVDGLGGAARRSGSPAAASSSESELPDIPTVSVSIAAESTAGGERPGASAAIATYFALSSGGLGGKYY